MYVITFYGPKIFKQAFATSNFDLAWGKFLRAMFDHRIQQVTLHNGPTPIVTYDAATQHLQVHPAAEPRQLELQPSY